MSTSSRSDSGGHWLEKNNAEYDQIHYYLQACLLNRGDIINLDIWKIENLELIFRYERRTSSMLKVASWMNSVDLDQDNKLEDVCQRGFTFTQSEQKGMEFSTGVIDFQSDDIWNTAFTFIYVEVAAGKSLIKDVSSDDFSIPPGYDSLYTPSKPLDRNKDGKFDLQEYQAAAHFDHRNPMDYHHKYFISDSSQVCPKYVVRFELQKKGIKGKLSQHLSSTINHEEDEEIRFFDPISFTPVSQRERGLTPAIIGTPSSRSDRPMISVEQAFAQALEDCQHQHQDPVVNGKKKWIDQQLGVLDDKVREINLNYAEISEAIDEAAIRARKELEKLTREKLETCLSMEVELRRQVEQLGWLDSIIEVQLKSVKGSLGNPNLSRAEKNRKKLDFLRSWKYHTIFRSSLSRAKPTELQELNKIHADIKMKSDLEIYPDSFFAAAEHQPPVLATALSGHVDNPNASAKSKKKGSKTKKPQQIDTPDDTPSIDELNQPDTETKSEENEEKEEEKGETPFPTEPIDTESIFETTETDGASDTPELDHPVKLTMSTNNVTLPPRTALVSPEMQNLVELEMSSIQQAVAQAMLKHPRSALPSSVMRPVVSGNRYPLSLHALLDGIADEPEEGDMEFYPFSGTSQKGASGVVSPASRPSSPLVPAPVAPMPPTKASFASALLDTIGESPGKRTREFSEIGTENNEDLSVLMSTPKHPGRLFTTLPIESVEDEKESPVRAMQLQEGKSSSTRGNQLQQVSSVALPEKDPLAEPEENQEVNLNIAMTIPQLKTATSGFSNYFIREIADRKRKQLKSKLAGAYQGLESVTGLMDLKNSLILTTVQAEYLYFSLPFFFYSSEL